MINKLRNINPEEWVGIFVIAFTIVLFMLLASCTSFKKIKQKHGHRVTEIENIPYEKTIGPDSAILHARLDQLLPNVPMVVRSQRSGITIMADASGNLTAKGYSDPIIIRDSIPYPVEKIIFKEAELDKYILKKDAIEERKAAVEMAVMEQKVKQVKIAGKQTFFDKVKNTFKDIGLGLVFILFLLLMVAFIAARAAGKFI